ncbi:DUF4328 domain-containing protein [Streptomyces sp. NPDC048349]|uniref:DUF4328 domain-containing protein n=1 Tax=Streptomyces sp. NPDC048349 TaxID=3155486 RepID=UPI003442943B
MPRASLPTRIPEAPRLLLAGVVVLLAAVILTDAFALYAGTRVYSLFVDDAGFVLAPTAELDAAHTLHRRAWMFQANAVFACGVVFIAWFHQMHRCVRALAPDRSGTGSGWAIGCWFVPLLNLWRPFRIALGMWGVCGSPAPQGRATPSPWPVGLWWGLFVGVGAFNQYAAWTYSRAETLAEARYALARMMVGDLLDIVAAVAAIHFAVRLTAMCRRRTG